MAKFFGDLTASIISSLVLFVVLLGITFLITGKQGTSWTLKTEKLHPISGLEFTLPNGNELQLGYKTTATYIWSLFGIGIENDGYVLIPAGQDQKYIITKTQTIQLHQELGLLPENIRMRPRTSLLVILMGNSFFVLLIAFLTWIGFLFWKDKQRRTEVEKELSFLSKFERALLETMIIAAKSDGDFSDDEQALISLMFQKHTEEPIDKERVDRAIVHLTALSGSYQYRAAKIGKSISSDERIRLIRAAVLILISDGKLEKPELRFLEEFAGGLGIPATEVISVFGELGLNSSTEK